MAFDYEMNTSKTFCSNIAYVHFKTQISKNYKNVCDFQ